MSLKIGLDTLAELNALFLEIDRLCDRRENETTVDAVRRVVDAARVDASSAAPQNSRNYSVFAEFDGCAYAQQSFVATSTAQAIQKYIDNFFREGSNLDWPLDVVLYVTDPQGAKSRHPMTVKLVAEPTAAAAAPTS